MIRLTLKLRRKLKKIGQGVIAAMIDDHLIIIILLLFIDLYVEEKMRNYFPWLLRNHIRRERKLVLK